MTAGTLGAVVDAAAHRLGRAGVDSPWLDARVLAAHALGVGREVILGHRERRLRPAECDRFETLVGRREAREPVSRLIGEREFWSLPFALGPAVLDPRPDSETLVEAALDLGVRTPRRASPTRVLDLGTGSGCLLLALLAELPGALGLGVDISADAARLARANAHRLGLADRARFVVGDWGDGVGGRWDIIVCNPPYIPDRVLGTLAPEVVLYDPARAFSAGPDGLACYRRIVRGLGRLLAAGGLAVLEIGAGQAPDVTALLAGGGLHTVALRTDLAGIPRCLLAAGSADVRMWRQCG